MLEYVIIILLVAFALGLIIWRVRGVIKGDNTCTGCASDCGSCSVVPRIIQEDNELE